MTLKTAHTNFISALQSVYDKDEAIVIRNLVFEWATGTGRHDITLAADKELTSAESEKISAALERLLKNEPVQYVTGEAWFYGAKFKVDASVLIPRPETEELVQEAIGFLTTRSSPEVLDIGTGSGCIPVSVKKKLPAANITAIDISEDALNIARENSRLINSPVNFLLADILKEDSWNNFGWYDAIISNPPYIPSNESKRMHTNVTAYEPHLALFVPDDDPLLFYKKIAAFANYHLKGNGKIFLETHEAYAKEVAAVLEDNNFTAQIKKDIPGKERMVIASRYH
ncbi:peptide chain release factor N(5)-glutamine methyltransferase [Ferruginibacter sp. HRS2-29]|uniref:peptide chain release factor N(5)-glutamine methyltransferase n=1 Tax=Ferruginibacter sp. HRS2-29 TaxID=2487334 RepID=UPI0020CD78CD|nr:peptide chain release factor N(5)-glutamine methyltransferase [Ferruginibacter sp. HRS2-29]MCP9753240.1 peptide chain release factor N(5)-glutamine methyltransferase [Ferruginibacter sp. HRS2-29]